MKLKISYCKNCGNRINKKRYLETGYCYTCSKKVKKNGEQKR